LDSNMERIYEDYIVIKAEENGVNIIGLTRGKDTKFHHTEKLDKGEVLNCPVTDKYFCDKNQRKSQDTEQAWRSLFR